MICYDLTTLANNKFQNFMILKRALFIVDIERCMAPNNVKYPPVIHDHK
uniref:Uncharacterized protein n=1 Tax=Arundo donax TaxID=35708 RepID=A0A0A9HDA1_ARUDO